MILQVILLSVALGAAGPSGSAVKVIPAECGTEASCAAVLSAARRNDSIFRIQVYDPKDYAPLAVSDVTVFRPLLDEWKQ